MGDARLKEPGREAPAPGPDVARRPQSESLTALAALHGRPEAVDAVGLLQLQRSVGNAGVSAVLADLPGGPGMAIQREVATASAPPATEKIPEWSDEELDTIQRELRRIGLYKMRIDHIFGGGTQSALVEAFGGHDWRTLKPAEIIERLRTAATPAKGKKHEHELRYGEMYQDGILDMTVGLGFTEETVQVGTQQVPYYLMLIPQFEKVLIQDHGFTKDHALAETVLKRAGRDIGKAAVGDFYVLEKALSYTPPAADVKTVDAVVRLLASGAGAGGGDVAAAFAEGMVQSDAAYYTGHGRYGSGPDFDRNFERFELLDHDGNITKTYKGGDYEEVGFHLAAEGKPHGRSDWDQFLWRVKNDRINVVTADLGNVYVNPQRREREFGAKLIYWALDRDGVSPVTGPAGTLAAGAAAHPEHRYHVDVFDGCRTRDYEKSIHGTSGQGTGSTDIIQTNRTVGFLAEAATFAAFLNSLIHMQSGEQVIKGMNQELKQHEEGYEGAAYEMSGMKYDPTGP